MKRNLKILENSFEIIQYYMPHTDFVLQENKLSYFENMQAICHWHDDIELIRITRGQMNFYVNGSTYLMKENTGLIVNSKQFHYGYSEQGGDCDFLCILIHPTLFNPSSDIYKYFVKPIIDNNKIEALYLRANHPTENNILSRLDDLVSSYHDEANTVSKELFCTSIIYDLWSTYYRIIQSQFDLSEITINNDLIIQKKMTSFIYQNYMHQLTLNDIAVSGNVCRSKCCKLFKHFVKQSPIDFLNFYRLEMSKNLLKKTPLSITQIAMNCGFNHLSYFSKMFWQKNNCSPKEYRKRDSQNKYPTTTDTCIKKPNSI